MLQFFLPNGILVKVFHMLETRNRQNFKVELNEILYIEIETKMTKKYYDWSIKFA
jgi:hypothetical protein